MISNHLYPNLSTTGPNRIVPMMIPIDIVDGNALAPCTLSLRGPKIGAKDNMVTPKKAIPAQAATNTFDVE